MLAVVDGLSGLRKVFFGVVGKSNTVRLLFIKRQERCRKEKKGFPTSKF